MSHVRVSPNTPHLGDYLAGLIGVGFQSPLESHLESSYITPESGCGGELFIDIWTDALPGFSFSKWNAYVASMGPRANEQP
ncbi:hypothetical protein IW262DRAFT_1465240 [Armillaria fumosa]|nr:hypothetical protein IW262DRAFT_1465240 [Armillaria fumosa]